MYTCWGVCSSGTICPLFLKNNPLKLVAVSFFVSAFLALGYKHGTTLAGFYRCGFCAPPSVCLITARQSLYRPDHLPSLYLLFLQFSSLFLWGLERNDRVFLIVPQGAIHLVRARAWGSRLNHIYGQGAKKSERLCCLLSLLSQSGTRTQVLCRPQWASPPFQFTRFPLVSDGRSRQVANSY